MRDYFQRDDTDPGHIPSLRARLSRTQVEFIDGMIPRRFVDRSDGIRRLVDIGIEHFPDDASSSLKPEGVGR